MQLLISDFLDSVFEILPLYFATCSRLCASQDGPKASSQHQDKKDKERNRSKCLKKTLSFCKAWPEAAVEQPQGKNKRSRR